MNVARFVFGTKMKVAIVNIFTIIKIDLLYFDNSIKWEIPSR